jgi:transcriptional regulator with XRE-family HTH domain
MPLSKQLKAFVDEAKQTDAYWVESAKLEFALALEQQRRAAGLSYADLAKKMGTSAAYISKVFRGDTNLTIESMVKLARATGGQLDARILVGDVAAKAYRRAAAVEPVSSALLAADSGVRR